METWKPIPKYPKYEASTFGRIRHVKHLKIRKLRIDPRGYARLSVANPITGKQDSERVHRLVAFAFLELFDNSVVDHIDRNKFNNRPDNLRITTMAGNNSNKLGATKQRIERIVTLHKQGFSVEEIYAAIR